MNKIKLGDIARDKITGFEGTVIGWTVYVNNCDRITIKSKGTHEGKAIDSHTFDVVDCEHVGPGDVAALPVSRGEVVELGDEAEDKLTGVVGIARQRTTWLAGCSTLMLQPKGLTDGKPIALHLCDEGHCRVVTRGKPTPAVNTGGPKPEPRRT